MCRNKIKSATWIRFLALLFLLLACPSDALELRRAPVVPHGGNGNGASDDQGNDGDRNRDGGNGNRLDLGDLERRERQVQERLETLQRAIADMRGNRVEQEFWTLLAYIRRVAGPNFQFEETVLPDQIVPESLTRIRASYIFIYRLWGLEIQLKQCTSHQIFNAVYNVLLGRDPETMRFTIENILIDFTGMHTHFEGQLWVPIVSLFFAILLKPWWFLYLGIIGAVVLACFFRTMWDPARSSFQFFGYLLFADVFQPFLNARGVAGAIVFSWGLWVFGAWTLLSLMIMCGAFIAVYYNTNSQENQNMIAEAVAAEQARVEEKFGRQNQNLGFQNHDFDIEFMILVSKIFFLY